MWQGTKRYTTIAPHLFDHTVEKIFKYKPKLDCHIRFKHLEFGKVCQICENRFKNSNALRRNMRSHEGQSTKEMCNKCYGIYKDLKNHFPKCKVEKVKKIKCDICNTFFVE